MQDNLPTMKRDDQITLRLAGSLRAALEDEAAERGRGLSNLCRTILIEHVSARIASLAGSAKRAPKISEAGHGMVMDNDSAGAASTAAVST